MLTKSSIFVRTHDGSPTTISGRGFGAQACRRHRVTDIDSAVTAGLIPRAVDAAALHRHTAKVLADDSFEQRARTALKATKFADLRVAKARITNEAHGLRVAVLAEQVAPELHSTLRTALAGRSLQIMTRAPFDVTVLQLDADLDLYTDLVLDTDINVARFGDVRIFSGAALVPTAKSFILHASSIAGNVQAVAAAPSGLDIHDHVAHLKEH